MKIYKVEYWDGDRSKPKNITELSKSETRMFLRILFLDDGRKCWHWKFKNNLLNGLNKIWWHIIKEFKFQNLKKQNAQGIEIYFHRI